MWIRGFLRFRGPAAPSGPRPWTHPDQLGAPEVEAFLTPLANRRKVAASTQNQALNAVVFLYRDVLKKELGEFDALRARLDPNAQFRFDALCESPHPPEISECAAWCPNAILIETTRGNLTDIREAADMWHQLGTRQN